MQDDVLETEPSYAAIRESALERLHTLQEAWTDDNPADTGIALLELMAWMQDNQNYYMRQYGKAYTGLFLKLLGMKRLRRAPAKTVVRLERPVSDCLERNMGFYADAIRLEPARAIRLTGGVLCACCLQRADGTILWRIEEKRELQYGVLAFGETPEAGNSLYMSFTEPFQAGGVYGLYLAVEEAEGRNPIPKESRQLFARYELESWNGEAWASCPILEDQTAGFLQSGFLYWSQESDMEAVEDCFFLRFHLLTAAYDLPPRLLDVDVQCVELEQRETLAFSEYVQKSDGTETPAKGRTGRWQWEWYQKQGQTYRLLSGKAEAEEAEGPFLRVGWNADATIPLFADANGFPDQRLELRDASILGSRLRVLIEEPDRPGIYREWEQVTDFWGQGPQKRCFVFQEVNGVLEFGNGEHGRIPEGRIRIIDLARTLGSGGMIKENQQIQWKYGMAYNRMAAQGGRETESEEEGFARYRREEQTLKLAVTLADYEALVRQTPALCIRRVKAISRAQEATCVTVVVEWKAGAGTLPEVYRGAILRWLEHKRVLGTEIRLEAPTYIEIEVRLELQLRETYLQAEAWIRQAVEAYFETYMQDFGAKLEYAQLYEWMDRLPCVRKIQRMKLEARGKGAQKLSDGSIRLPEEGLAVLTGVDIQKRRGR